MYTDKHKDPAPPNTRPKRPYQPSPIRCSTHITSWRKLRLQPNKASQRKILLLTPRDMHNTLCTIFSPTNFADPRTSLLLTTHLAYLYPTKKEKKIVSIQTRQRLLGWHRPGEPHGNCGRCYHPFSLVHRHHLDVPCLWKCHRRDVTRAHTLRNNIWQVVVNATRYRRHRVAEREENPVICRHPIDKPHDGTNVISPLKDLYAPICLVLSSFPQTTQTNTLDV